LPVGAYARIVLPAGEHVLAVRDPMWDARTSDQTSTEDDLPWGDVPWWAVIVGEILTGPDYSSEEFDRKPRTIPVQCRAGESLYLQIDATFKGKGQHWFPMELRSVDAAEAQGLMAHMAQLLPPDY